MTGTKIRYARCSTDKQDLQANWRILLELGVPADQLQLHLDRAYSGTNRARPGLDQALAAVRGGDTRGVPKLDRLARSVPDARQIGDSLAARGVRLQLGTMIYEPANPMGKMFFTILATFAEFEVDLLRMRTREGMAIAKAKGRLKGRAPKLSLTRQAHLLKLHAASEHRGRARRVVRGVPADDLPGPGTRSEREQRRMNTLHITTAPVADGILGVCIAGEVDMATAEQVVDAVRAVLAARPPEVHVDMAAMTFLDSSGIRTLLQVQREAAERGIMLSVVNPHRQVVKVLDLTGLLDLLQAGRQLDPSPPPTDQ